MPGILLEIVEHKRIEVEQRKSALPQSHLEKMIEPADGRFQRALAEPGLKLITEIKPSSPSAGVLKEKVDIDAVLAAYNPYASAISVLTDKKYFNGSLDLMSEVVAKSLRPVLCKDFLLDAYQVCEARLAGAQAVLLIVKILEQAELHRLHEAALNLGMTPVVEVQTEEELELALELSPQVVLINNRDLTTFEIDLATTEKLAPLLPPSVAGVSASGIQSRAHIERLLPYCRRFLIGSSLMQAEDLESKLKEMTGQ
jgi:indole-3-glycerol phosphate synthase